MLPFPLEGTHCADVHIGLRYGKLGGSIQRALAIVDNFLATLRTAFPAVIIDERHINLDSLGYHLRGDWDTHFDMGKQLIYLNARVSILHRLDEHLQETSSDHDKRVHDMVVSATIPSNTDFQTFMFLFGNMFFHEIGGHILVTYLGKNRLDTPPGVAPASIGYILAPGLGESGRLLEERVLGGTLEAFGDPAHGMRQVPSFLTMRN